MEKGYDRTRCPRPDDAAWADKVTGGQCLEPVEEGLTNLCPPRRAMEGRCGSHGGRVVIDTASVDLLEATPID